MNIIFPVHEIDKQAPDDLFCLEYNAANTCGLKTFLFDYDKFVDKGELSSNLPASTEIQPLILRGYMMKANQYEVFANLLSEKNYILINDSSRYKRCHHSHEIHHLFGTKTPKMLCIPNLTKELFEKIFTTEVAQEKLEQMKKDFHSEFFILKDSVKSEKDIPELFKIPLNIYPKEFHNRLKRFIETRGKSYNDGLVFKEFVDFKQYPFGKTNEWRAFYLNGELVSISQNTEIKKGATNPDIKWLEPFTKHILSNFFTVDIAEKADGTWTVVETGDGQVSGLSPYQNELKFYSKIKQILKNQTHVVYE